jgi:hypothetical protein
MLGTKVVSNTTVGDKTVRKAEGTVTGSIGNMPRFDQFEYIPLLFRYLIEPSDVM